MSEALFVRSFLSMIATKLLIQSENASLQSRNTQVEKDARDVRGLLCIQQNAELLILRKTLKN